MLSRQRCREGSRTEAGFTIIEVLVGALLVSMIIGGLLSMVTNLQFAYAQLDNRSASHQAARVAIDWVQRDLTVAGVGLAPMVPVFPFVVPLPDGGLEIRHNSDGVRTAIRADSGSGSNLLVEALDGFAAGDTALVYDETGAFDIVTIESLLPASREVVLAAATGRIYTPGFNAVLAQVRRIRYRLADVDGVQNVTRQLGDGPQQALAADIEWFRFVYFDDSLPSVRFDPVTPAQQTRIRTIDALLAIRVPSELIDGEWRLVTLSSRMSPRGLTLRGGGA